MIAIMLLLYSLFAVMLFIYGGFLCYLLIRLFLFSMKTETIKTGTQFPDVSVVIPFRNEANNLEKLVNSLGSQKYNGKYEVILVNDGSTDDYEKTFSSISALKTVKVIQSYFAIERGLTSKQQALDTGIKAAVHDWIACTDADMLLEPRWLEALMLPAASGADLVFGHTVITSGKINGLSLWFQKFQLETLFAVAYILNRAGLSGSCMGNNLLFSRKAYLETGGFDSVGYSIVEDMDLMLLFRRKKLLTTATEPFSPTARTFPAATVNDSIQQLLRWSRGGLRRNPVLMFAFVLLTAQNIFLVFSLFRALPGFIGLASAANLLLTWMFVAVAFRRIKSGENVLLFIPFYVLYLVESALLFLFSVFNKKIFWKNRHIA
jgi:cellulose synthase/poly-beta-1,6-N-acetylglucosamine synthase-like glycosyltransferase